MIIECNSCQARFRLDESKIKGKAAKVQCRKCGNSIYVTKPEMLVPGEESFLDLRSLITRPADLAPSAAPEPPGPRAVPKEEPGEEPAKDEKIEGLLAGNAYDMPPEPDFGQTPAAPDAAAATVSDSPDAAIPGVAVEFAPEEKLTFALDTEPAEPVGNAPIDVVPPEETLPATFAGREEAAAAGSEPYDISGNLDTRPETVREVPESRTTRGEEAGEPRPAPEEETVESPDARGAEFQEELRDLATPSAPPPTPIEDAQPMPHPTAAAPRPASAPPPGKSTFSSPLVLSLVALFVLLAAGGAFLGFTRSGQDTMRGLVSRIEAVLGSGKKASPGYDVENVIGYYEVTTEAGKMFIIKGQVRNAGRSSRSGLKVHAAIMDAGSKELAKKAAYAGNVVGAEALRHADRARIEAELSRQFGGNLVNLDIAPGKTVPFMIIFFDAPDGIDAYRIEAREGE